MLELEIDSIRVSLRNYQRVVILKVKDSALYLPIWIGPSEADSIALKLQEVSVPRPLTHDLLCGVITSLKGTVQNIVISNLSDDTFFAKIIVEQSGSTIEIDSRPSDAIAIAIRTSTPIYAEEKLINQAAVKMNNKPDPSMPFEKSLVKEDELKNLSAYTDFVDTLDLEDIGK
ncbi:MAG: bifunctional nuclease family protein [Dehalococcoidia bacterium]